MRIVGLVGALVLVAPRLAMAAAAPPCVAPQLFPSAAIVPADLPAFGYTATRATADNVQLAAVSGGTSTPVPLDFEVVDGLLKMTPTTPLVAGTTYQLTYSNTCYSGTTNLGPYKFTAGASAPLPTKLGAIQGTPTVVTKDYGTTRFAIDATYALEPQMKPWAAVFKLLVVLDGKIVGTKATVSADGASVAVDATGWCDATTAATNPHQVSLRAQLPFATTLDTAATPMTFNCPAQVLNTPVGAAPPTSATSTTTVAHASDGGTSNNATAASDSGCSAAGSSSSPLSCLAVSAAVAAMLRRRRRETTATRRT